MSHHFISEDEGTLLVKLDMSIYSLAALLKTAYWYTERCYLHLQSAENNTVEARFRPKSSLDFEHLPEQFMNDLLCQTLQERVAKESEPFKNLILAHALSKTSLVNPEKESLEPFDDPCGIRMPDDAKNS